jgi:hypothetical protein
MDDDVRRQKHERRENLESYFGEWRMKRSLLGGLCLASILSVGLAGCGGGTMDEGMPTAGEIKTDVPLDPKMVNMSGASFADQKKAAAKNAAAGRAAAAAAAAPPSGAEKQDNE